MDSKAKIGRQPFAHTPPFPGPEVRGESVQCNARDFNQTMVQGSINGVQGYFERRFSPTSKPE